MARDKKSKRQLIRDEKKAKKRQREIEIDETKEERKRQRVEAANGDGNDGAPFNDDGYGGGVEQMQYFGGVGGPAAEPEREFFGMLTDEEQEYFRSADEKLETNDFESDEDRGYFLQSVYTEAVGKELKLASSQSCSRLMERLILLSNTRQKKRLFEAFTEHFVSLVTHRFASHCCEKLFIQSAPVVTRELSGMAEEEEQGEEGEGESESEQKATKASMEDLFLFTLDELEVHLSYLLSDRFGSHALRVLLVVLSGRPLDQVSTKSLLQSKRKEHISVQGGRTETDDMNGQTRVVPESFTLATQKILEDTTVSMDSTALRVLATHPTGNPVLQLLVDLDISLNGKDKEKRDQLLLLKLLPGAPESLSDNSTPASDFVNSTMYDPIGSRLLETIVTHAPAKIFKALNANFFGPRIHTYLRNDIACYPAIKALNRMGKDDVAESARRMVPEMPKVVAANRYNVLKALFERCKVRQVTQEIEALLEALCTAYGSRDGLNLVPRLCGLEAESASKDDDPAKKFQPSLQADKQKAATLSHGCQLATALLSIPGAPAKTLQQSMLSLSTDQLLHLATSTTPSMIVVKTALSSPAEVPNFHKALVTKLAPSVMELAHSQIGHNVVNSVVGIPSKAAGREAQAGVVPFHLKERIMNTLGTGEKGLRESWTGRSVWRTWKGDQWKFRRGDWVRFVKEVDPEVKPEEKLWNRVADKERGKGKKKNRVDKERPRENDGDGQ
ncbi:putative nucleolar protein 9 [Diaporthe ampelina]|uniref:Nucleolar protein 9 n=1 Tax=Diaporthe ampelina TaxID=1214573 RepID=A0A0G2FPW4_9PEZI|nr:putative nucleolar protein 9 [Diaporthe ampelina]